MTTLKPLRALVILFTLALLACSATSETFRNPLRIATPVDPATVTAGDLNGDGVADFVWLQGNNPKPATLNVLLSQPGGGWLPGASIPFPIATTSGPLCSLTDVDGDKRLDLVCAAAFQFKAGMYVFLGNGDGTFQAPVITDISPKFFGNWIVPAFSVLGDLNGDGHPDLFAEDLSNGNGKVLLGDGKGGFKVIGGIQTGYNNVLPVSGDVNGDGIPDLLYPFGPQVGIGKGDGTFALPVSYTDPSYYAASCVFHDMDGDGHLDAVCGYEDSTSGQIAGSSALIILHGNADGSFNTTPIAKKTFGARLSSYDGFGTFHTPLAIADINGDGILDVIGAAGDGLTVLLGGPKLTYSAPLHYAQSLVIEFGILSNYQSQIIDVNGDGIPDFVSVGTHGIYISYGKPDGSFNAAFAPEVTGTLGYPTVADFNGDGIPDIAATGDSTIFLSLGKGDGTFSAPVALPNQSGAVDFGDHGEEMGAHILHGDFNGDGKLDLMAIGSASVYQYASYILFGNGDGTFREPVLVPNSSVIWPMYSQLADTAVYDINHDGRSDIVTSVAETNNGTGQIIFGLSNGDGTFSNVTSSVPLDVRNGFERISPPALADFDGDGKLDAVYGGYATLYVVKGNGNGSFSSTAASVLQAPTVGGVGSDAILEFATGDFDGDSKQDFAALVQYPNGSALWIYYGRGDGTFDAPALAAQFDRYYTNVAVSDLNRDGLADFVVKTSGSLGGGYSLGIIHSLPGRTFAPEVNYAAGTGLGGWNITDLNGDGFPDIVIGNGDFNIRAGSVAVLMNLGNTLAVTGTVAASPEPSLKTQPFTITARLSPPVPATLHGNIQVYIDGLAVGSAVLNGNKASVDIPAGRAIGSHTLGASWPGDSTFPAVDMSGAHLISADPTLTTINTSNNHVTVGATVTFTSAVTSTYGSPAGSVLFSENGTPLQSVKITGGTAVLSTSSLASGTHSIRADYQGDDTFGPSSAMLTETVDAIPSSVTLVADPDPAYVNQTVTLRAQVTAANAQPTGTVSFYDAGAAIGTASLDTSGVATLTATFSAAGTHVLTAQYGGNSSVAASNSSPWTETILLNPTTASVSASPNPGVAFANLDIAANVTSGGSPVTSGTVSITANGRLLSTATLQSGTAHYSTNALGAGTYLITAAFSGNSTFNTSTSPVFTEIVNKRASTTLVASSGSPSVIAHSVTFTATVAASGPATAGSVQFFDGATALGGPVALTSSGTATYSTSALTLGTHSITAAYTGDANTQGSQSPALPQTVIAYAGDFSISIDPRSSTLYTGEKAVLHVTVTSHDGFNEPVELSCGALPPGTTCTFSTASFSAGQGTGTLTIQTTSPQRSAAAVTSPAGPHRERFAVSLAFVLGGLLFLPAAFKRNRLFVVALGAFVLTGVSACVTSGRLSNGTPPGSYDIQVSGAYTAPAPQLRHSADVTIKVKSLF